VPWRRPSPFAKQQSDAIRRFEELNPLKSHAYSFYWECCFRPGEFHETRFSLDELRAAAYKASIDFRGWPFLFIHANRPDVTYNIQDGVETLIHTQDFRGGEMLDFWRLQQSGFFYHRRLAHGIAPDSKIADLV